MSTTFPEYKGLNLPNVADEMLKFWEDHDIFDKSITSRNGKPPYVFFEGPPSANGLPGVHHVLARAIKDIFPRYKTMKGFQVNRKAGWDTHGLPIELGVEKELGITKEDIGKTISVEDYNTLRVEPPSCATQIFGMTLLKKWGIGSIWTIPTSPTIQNIWKVYGGC